MTEKTSNAEEARPDAGSESFSVSLLPETAALIPIIDEVLSSLDTIGRRKAVSAIVDVLRRKKSEFVRKSNDSSRRPERTRPTSFSAPLASEPKKKHPSWGKRTKREA